MWGQQWEPWGLLMTTRARGAVWLGTRAGGKAWLTAGASAPISPGPLSTHAGGERPGDIQVLPLGASAPLSALPADLIRSSELRHWS
jgi:hypothetical protein